MQWPSRTGCCFLVLVLSGIGLDAQRSAFPDFDQVVLRELVTSRVRDHLFYLTDVVGPRVVGSPGLENARRWLEERLAGYRLQSIRREANLPMEA